MKHFILILACLCAMSCSRQTTGIDAFVNQYDQASVRMPGILMPLVKKKLHKAGINVNSIKVLTPEKLQNDSALLKRYLDDLEMLDFKDYSKMVEVKEDDENYLNAVDYMFKGLEKRKPDCFAVKQYRKYKLRSGVVCSKRLLNQVVGKSLRTHNLKS